MLVASVLISSWVYPVRAQQFQKECDDTDSEKCSQPLMAGEVAPFSGQLLTPKLAIDLGQKAAAFEVQLQIELEYQGRLRDLDWNLEKEKHRIDEAACTEKVNLLTDQLKDAKLEHWYQHPLFVSSISVVLTTLIFVGATYLVRATTD